MTDSSPQSGLSSDRAEQPARPLVAWRLVLLLVAAVAVGGYWLAGWRTSANGDRTVRHARKLLASGNPAAARESLRWLLHFKPRHPDALLIVGKTWLAQGDAAAAVASLERVPVKSEAHQEAEWTAARALLGDGQIDRAETLLREHLWRYPAAREARNELRWVYFNEFRLREMERLQEAALEPNPADVETLSNLLLTEFRNPVPREGLPFLQQVEARRPGQAGVLHGLAYCYWQLGDVEQARTRLDAALAKEPASLETWFLALEFRLEQDLDQDWQQTFATVARTFPPESPFDVTRDDRWWWVRGRVAEGAADWEGALGDYSRAIELRPFELRYVHRRATVLQRLGRRDEAARDFERASELEACQKRLTEIVYGGALERLTPEQCGEVAELCGRRGKSRQTQGWRQIADRLREQPGGQHPNERTTRGQRAPESVASIAHPKLGVP